jgi:hypothetical protein
MLRLIVLPVLVLVIPPILVVAFYLVRDKAGELSRGGSPDISLDSGPNSPMPALETRLTYMLRGLYAAVPLEKVDGRLRGQLDRASAHLSGALVLSITAGACVIGLLAVGLVRGAAARRRMIANFGFSSPTRFLLAKAGLAVSVVAGWALCFVPLVVAPFVAVGLTAAFCGTFAFSFLLAKHFPIVW